MSYAVLVIHTFFYESTLQVTWAGSGLCLVWWSLVAAALVLSCSWTWVWAACSFFSLFFSFTFSPLTSLEKEGRETRNLSSAFGKWNAYCGRGYQIYPKREIMLRIAHHLSYYHHLCSSQLFRRVAKRSRTPSSPRLATLKPVISEGLNDSDNMATKQCFLKILGSILSRAHNRRNHTSWWSNFFPSPPPS